MKVLKYGNKFMYVNCTCGNTFPHPIWKKVMECTVCGLSETREGINYDRKVSSKAN